MERQDDVRLLYVTCPTLEVADAIGRTLVDEGLVACVNILPGMRSIYRWQGAVEQAEEVVVLAKTIRGMVDPVTKRILEVHPYDEPCVVSLPIDGGSSGFLQWVRDHSRG